MLKSAFLKTIECKWITSLFFKADKKNAELFERIQNILRQFDGHLLPSAEKTIEVVFGAPIAYEDHALRACLAADRIKQYLVENHPDSGYFMGLDSFEALVEIFKNEELYYEPVAGRVNLAEELMNTAAPNHIQISESIVGLLGDYIQITPIDLSRPLEPKLKTYLLQGINSENIQKTLDTQIYHDRYFVGRETELALFTEALKQSSAGQPQILAILAEAGLGKTRLFYECLSIAQNQKAVVHSVSSNGYQRNSTLFSLRLLVQSLLGLKSSENNRQVLTQALEGLDFSIFSEKYARFSLLSLLGVEVELAQWQQLAPNLQKDILFQSIWEWLKYKSQTHTLIVVFEDLHWCDRGGLEFIDFLSTQLFENSILLLLDYRPEFERSNLLKAHSQEIILRPLEAEFSQDLLKHLLPGEESLNHLREYILNASGGNPFFMEEYVKMAIEQHKIIPDASGYHLQENFVVEELPPKIQNVITARVDQLSFQSKHLLQQASILGLAFPVTLLRYLNELPDDLFKTSLLILIRHGFLVEVALFPEPQYQFKHAYLQEVVYDSLLNKTKRKYHQRLVEKLEQLEGQAIITAYPLLAEHAYHAQLWRTALYYYNAQIPNLVSLDFPAARYLEFGSYIQRAYQGLDRADRVTYFTAYGRSTVLQIHALFILGKADEAMQLADGLIGVADTVGNSFTGIVARCWTIILLFNQQRSTEAYQQAAYVKGKISHALSELSPEKAREFKAGIDIFLMHPSWALGHYAEFDTLVEEALELLKDKPYTYTPDYLGNSLASVLYVHLYSCHCLRARFDRLETSLGFLQGLSFELPISEPLALTQISLLIYYYTLGDFKKAKVYAEASVRTSHSIGQSFLELMARSYDAALSYQQGEYSQALTKSMKVFSEFKRMHYLFAPQQALLSLEILARCGAVREAYTGVEDILKLAVDDHQKPLLAQSYRLKALMHLLQIKNKSAEPLVLELLSQAKTLTEQLGCRSLDPWIEINRAEYHQALGNEQQRDIHLKQGLAYFKQYGMLGWSAYYHQHQLKNSRVYLPLQSTFLVADIQGSTELMRDKDLEEGGEWLTQAMNIMETAVTQCQGRVLQTAGDGIWACFQGKNQSLRAIAAALNLQSQLKASALPLKARVGLDASLFQKEIYGLNFDPALQLAEMIEAQTKVNEVQISQRVYEASASSIEVGQESSFSSPEFLLPIKLYQVNKISDQQTVSLMQSKKSLNNKQHPLDSSGERKQITSLFIKLAIGGKISRQEAEEKTQDTFLRVSKLIKQFNGTVIRASGDLLFAIFGAPVAYADHPLRASIAAYLIQQNLAELDDDLKFKMGLHSGEAVVDEMGLDESRHYDALGVSVNLAARMMQTATEQQIQLTTETATRVMEYIKSDTLGFKVIKGFEMPIACSEIRAIFQERLRRQFASELYKDSYFVGREEELSLFLALWAQVCEGASKVLAIKAEAGLGKTRLLYEYSVKVQAQEARIYSASSSAYEKAESFSTVRSFIKNRFSLASYNLTEPQRLNFLAQLNEYQFTEKLGPLSIVASLGLNVQELAWKGLAPIIQKKILFQSLIELMEQEAKVTPLLLIFEDLHWCDNDSLEFIEVLVSSQRLKQVAILLDYRPEYNLSEKLRSLTQEIQLQGLSEKSSLALIEHFLPGGDGLDILRKKILEVVDGNPLFIEEYVKSLIAQGNVYLSGTEYQLKAGLNLKGLPQTIQAIISAQVDQLSAENKTLLQQASILGRVFPLSLLAYLSPLSENEFKTHLQSLEESGFLSETAIFPEPEYSFKHANIRDTVYQTMLVKSKRAYHEHLVLQLEANEKEQIADFYFILAEHAYRAKLWIKALYYYNAMTPTEARIDFPNSRYLEVGPLARHCFEELSQVQKNENFYFYGRIQSLVAHALLALDFGSESFSLIQRLVAESVHFNAPKVELMARGWQLAMLFTVHKVHVAYTEAQNLLKSFEKIKAQLSLEESIELEILVYTVILHTAWPLGHYQVFDGWARHDLSLLEQQPYNYTPEIFGANLSGVWFHHVFFSHCLRAYFELISEKLFYLQEQAKKLSIGEPLLITQSCPAIYYYTIGDLNTAEDYACKALEISESIELLFIHRMMQVYRAAIYYYRGATAEALALAQNCAQGYKQKDYAFSPQVAVLAAEILGRCGAFEEALTMVEDIIAIAKADEQRPMLAQIYRVKALIYNLSAEDASHDQDILELLAEAQAITLELGCNSLHPYIHLNYAEFYTRLGETKKVLEHHEKALAYFKDYGMLGWYEYYQDKLTPLSLREGGSFKTT